MNGRIIAIGDIHGCHQELAELLERLALTKDDRLILVGDLINRGPDSCKVIDLARQYNAVSLLGNHELRLLGYRDRKTPIHEISRETDADTFKKLRPEDWDYLDAMPLTCYIEEYTTVFVHGGFLPNTPWQNQPAAVVTRIQSVDAKGRACKRADAPNAPPNSNTSK